MAKRVDALQKESPSGLTIEALDREMIARIAKTPGENPFKFKDNEGTPHRHTLMAIVKELYAAAPPANPVFSHISTRRLLELLLLKNQKLNEERAIWGKDNRMDFYQLEELEKSARQCGIAQPEKSRDSVIKEIKEIKKNADCVAAICMKENLIDKQNGYSAFNVKNYGHTFNLHENEPFRTQPISAGWLCTGFLVKEDIIATAGHCADENNVTDLRITFGFKMHSPFTPVTWVSNKDIYKGVEIIGRAYNRSNGADWALVKLDRKVKGHPVAKLSEKSIYLDQPVYILGHPCGLPLKYSAGAKVCGINESFFSADLNVYCGNSGSPVFDRETHEVIGIVVRGDCQDFRWTGEGWLSIIYPHPDFHSKEPQCTRVSEFIDCCR